MASNEDILLAVGYLQAEVAESRKDIASISVQVVGNGSPKDGLVYKVTKIEENTGHILECVENNKKAIAEHTKDKKNHGFGWWKHRYIAVIAGWFVAMIAVWFALFALATKNQELLLKIIEAI